MATGANLLDLAFLSPEERDVIMSVLERDAAVQQKEQLRVNELKKEMREMRLRGVIRGGDTHDATKTCARCRLKFGWVFNKPRVCIQCSHRVCIKCCQPLPNRRSLCSICIKQMSVLQGRAYCTCMSCSQLLPECIIENHAMRYANVIRVKYSLEPNLMLNHGHCRYWPRSFRLEASTAAAYPCTSTHHHLILFYSKCMNSLLVDPKLCCTRPFASARLPVSDRKATPYGLPYASIRTLARLEAMDRGTPTQIRINPE